MSNLQSFIGRNATPPLGQSPRPDRLAQINELKVKSGKYSSSIGHAGKRLSSTAPAPGYASNNNYGMRSTDHNPQYAHPEVEEPGAFDDTITSNLEDTKSDILSYQRINENGQEEGSYAAREEHRPRHYENDPQAHPTRNDAYKQNQAQTSVVNSNAETLRRQSALPGISGRFEALEYNQHPSDFQLRPGQNEHQHVRDARKRGRSTEPFYQGSCDPIYQESEEAELEGSEDDDSDLPGPGFLKGGRGREENRSPHRVPIDTTYSSTPIGSPNRPLKERVQARDISPDYSEEDLKGMKYNRFEAESWETIPNVPEFVLAQELHGPDATLGTRIDYYSKRSHNSDKPEDLDAHAEFYANLSTAEWEEAGDYLVDKFTYLLQQIKKAKQDKRKRMEEFEAEIEVREKAVRGKSEKFDAEFNDMKASGEGLLKGKDV
jgi:hypothetical protein